MHTARTEFTSTPTLSHHAPVPHEHTASRTPQLAAPSRDTDSMHREAITTLASAPQYAGESKLRVLFQLPWRQKFAYFREHFLIPLIAAIVIITIGSFVIAHIVHPPVRPSLYVAVVDSSLPLGQANALQQSLESRFDNNVVIDDYFDTSKDGLSKLQTMLSNEQIDVVIAPPAVFTQLAGYGYFANMQSSLPAQQYQDIAPNIVQFHGFNDDDLSDALDDSGSGKGALEPYGISLTNAATWHEYAGPSPMMLGITANTQHTAHAHQFITILTS